MLVGRQLSTGNCPHGATPVGMAAVAAWDPCARRMQGDKGVQVDLELSCSGPSKTDRQCGVHLEGTDRLSDVSALLCDGVGCCGFDGEFYLHTHHRPRNRSDPSTLGATICSVTREYCCRRWLGG